MTRQHAFANGYAAHKKNEDAYYHKSYSERSDLENKYIWGHQNADLVEDEKDDYTYKGKLEPRRYGISSRQRLLRVLGVAAALFTLILYLASKHMSSSTDNSNKSGKIYEIETVRYYDLEDMQGTSVGWTREERVLLCTPLRDASAHLPMFFGHLRNFTYPHHLVDLAFLVSDSKDDTEAALNAQLDRLQNDPDSKMPFGEISVIHKDFGQAVSQDAESRHGFAVQASRRKLMAQARNWLLSAALRPYHSWVYWRDADVETCPFTIIEDLMRHDKDVIVPNVWRPLPDWLGGEQPYDLNSWQESETAIALADTLDEDAVIVEGYAEYATWRPHLAYLRDPYGDPDVEMELDGVGGVSILAKAKVFRSGVHFPAFSFERHAETEGFGKMAKRMKFSVFGLPHYTIWHLYEPSVDDIKHMEEMEKEKKEKEAKEKEQAERQKKIKEEFRDESKQWEKDKAAIEKITSDEMRKKMEEAIANTKTSKDASSKDDSKLEESKKEGSKKEEPEKVESKKDEPKKVEPKKDEPKKVEAKKDEPKKVNPKKDEHKKVETKKDEPRKEDPKQNVSKKVEPKKDEGKKEESKKDDPNKGKTVKIEDPKPGV